MITFNALPRDLLEEILFRGEGHTPSFLVTKTCNSLCRAVWYRIAETEQYSLLSKIRNPLILIELFTRWGKPIQDWCLTQDIFIHRHLIHQTCQDDKHLGLLTLELSGGCTGDCYAYDLMPAALQDDPDIINAALQHSNGYVFCILSEKHRIKPDILFKVSQLFTRPKPDNQEGTLLICQNYVLKNFASCLKSVIAQQPRPWGMQLDSMANWFRQEGFHYLRPSPTSIEYIPRNRSAIARIQTQRLDKEIKILSHILHRKLVGLEDVGAVAVEDTFPSFTAYIDGCTWPYFEQIWQV